MIPGEYILKDDPIILNEGREHIQLAVTNVGDRPVQVGSHFHFFEVNRCLHFARPEAFGKRLDIPSGNSIRFEPGETKTVDLIEIGGARRYVGFNALTMGDAADANKAEAVLRMKERDFETEDE